MGTTAIYQFPYPELTDPPDGPAQIKALAQAIETKVAAIDAVDAAIKQTISKAVSGTWVVNLNANSVATLGVTFAGASFTAIPAVMGMINSGASGTNNKLQLRHVSVTTTGFTVAVVTMDSSAVTVAVAGTYLAVQPSAVFPTGLGLDDVVPDGWHDAVLICHNPGCVNDSDPLTMPIPDDPEAMNFSAQCGGCGQPITDIGPAPMNP
jgi:hypothetical protein